MTPASDWILGVVGGGMIGLAAVMLMGLVGQIAGVSGILGSLVGGKRAGAGWRAMFVGGLILGPLLVTALSGDAGISIRVETNWLLLVLGGLLVGFGTRLGGGCTSGHGICGLAQLNWRSVIAVATFFSVAVVTVFLIRHVIGL